MFADFLVAFRISTPINPIHHCKSHRRHDGDSRPILTREYPSDGKDHLYYLGGEETRGKESESRKRNLEEETDQDGTKWKS